MLGNIDYYTCSIYSLKVTKSLGYTVKDTLKYKCF